MIYLHFIFLVFLFTTALGSTKEDHSHFKTSSNQRKIVQETLTDDDITVSYLTNYDSNLDITAVTQENNPDDYLNIRHKIVQDITILGQYTTRLELENEARADIYDPEPYEKTYNIEKTGIPINGGAITANVDLKVTETLQRNVNFTDLDWCSTIQFDAVITGETSLTLATGSIKDINRTVSNYPENYSFFGVSDASPLVAVSGQDSSTCHDETCESNTMDKTDMSGYYVFDNVYIMTIKRVYASASSTKSTDGAMYSMQSVITVDGFVQICSDGTL
ncbi:uncharacterized protein LOC130448648 isoform X1 [Diorhabda sublineata]|uniref:uncharacterized protein LOC130448648 isoform X1 n=1 Tax=Diorhabda sublineata TaxID=1163346 RepID=UPI0024E05DFC|nr:uncharacterized protein LOC130448648 isoform X1 [Diorhabda sublineata]